MNPGLNPAISDAQHLYGQLHTEFRYCVYELCRRELNDVANIAPTLRERLTEELFPLALAMIAADRNRVAAKVTTHLQHLPANAITHDELAWLAAWLRSTGDDLCALNPAPPERPTHDLP